MTETLASPSGEDAVAESTWRRVHANLRAFLGARVGDRQLAEDLTQEVVLRMHERREQLRDEERLDAWAFRIARNVLIDHRRRHVPQSVSADDETLGLGLPSELDRAIEADDRAPRFLGAWVRQRITTLPPKMRAALELTELEGLSQREAAERLGVPLSTLKSRVQRGRERLHAELLACCAVELDARGRVTDFAPRGCGPCGCD